MILWLNIHWEKTIWLLDSELVGDIDNGGILLRKGVLEHKELNNLFDAATKEAAQIHSEMKKQEFIFKRNGSDVECEVTPYVDRVSNRTQVSDNYKSHIVTYETSSLCEIPILSESLKNAMW